MTSKLVVNTIEADTGISSVSFASSISMSSTSKFHFGDAGIDIGADTNINRPAAGVLGFNINDSQKVVITSNGRLGIGTNNPTQLIEVQDRSTGTVCGLNVGTQYGNAHFGGYNNYPAIMNSGNQPLIYCDTNNDRTVLFGDTVGFGTTCAFRVNGAERFRIDSSGRLLLGTTTEGQATADDLTIATSGTTGITIRSGTGNDGNIYFSDGTSGSDEFRGYIQYGHSTNSLVFGTNSIERLRIASNGLITVNRDGVGGRIDATAGDSSIKISDGNGRSSIKVSDPGSGNSYEWELTSAGNFKAPNGKGIDFSATAGTPSNGGELLDDYEEGNFTASLGGVSNYSSYNVTGVGHYVKIGKAVHINIHFQNVNLNNSASGTVIIYNLPFVPFVVSGDCRGISSNYSTHKVQHASDGMIHSFFITTTYGFRGLITKNNADWTSWDASNFTRTGVYMDFSGTYFTAS